MRALSVPVVLGVLLAASASPAIAVSHGSKSHHPTPTPVTTPTPTPTATPTPSPTSVTTTTSSSSPKASPYHKGHGTPTPTPVAVVTPPPACGGSLGIFGTAATDCAGFYSGNVLSNSVPTGDVATQTAALALLGFTFTDFDSYLKIDTSDATFLDFGQMLYGDTIIGIHFGNGSGVGNNTAFFEFNFTSPVNGISLDLPGSSGVVLYTTQAVPTAPVPEPATWAMMLLGFGAAGVAMRRKRKQRPLLSQLA